MANKKDEHKANLFLFTGEDRISLKKQLDHWKKQFIEKHQDINLENLEIKTQSSLKELAMKMNALPFLSEKRLIVANGIPPMASESKELSSGQLNYEDFIESLQTIPNSTILILTSPKPDKRTRIYKQLKKIAAVKEFNVLSGERLTGWIQQMMKEEKRRIGSEVAEYLNLYCGQNMQEVQSEMEKLIIATREGQEISMKLIRTLCNTSDSQSIFYLTEQIGGKDPKKLIDALRNMLKKGEALQMIFFMLIRQIRLLMQVKYLLEQGKESRAIQARLKLHPFQVKKLMEQAAGIDLGNLKTLFKKFLEIDRKVKTGRIPSSGEYRNIYQLAIERVLLDI
jgi:DNA polymerase III subunit delta